jgi:hypothetical protein
MTQGDLSIHALLHFSEGYLTCYSLLLSRFETPNFWGISVILKVLYFVCYSGKQIGVNGTNKTGGSSQEGMMQHLPCFQIYILYNQITLHD